MQLKIGSFTEEARHVNNEIYLNPVQERLYIELKNVHCTAQTVVNSIEENYTGTLTILYDDEIEETFTGYVLESVRKMYNDSDTQICIDFIKLEQPNESASEGGTI